MTKKRKNFELGFYLACYNSTMGSPEMMSSAPIDIQISLGNIMFNQPLFEVGALVDALT